MTKIEPSLKDIESALSMLEPEQIAKLMGGITVNRYIHKVDTSFKQRRLAINDLYFNSAICPHQVESFETYSMHDEGIRQQVLSGVEL